MEETAIEYIIVEEALFLVVKYFKEVEKSQENEYALMLRVYRITDKNELKNCDVVMDV